MAKQRIIAAVDLGTSKTATAIAEIGDVRGIYLLSLSSVPTDGMTKGVVRDLNAVGMSIYQSFSQAAHTVGEVPEHVYVSATGASIESYDIRVALDLGSENEEVTEEITKKLREKLWKSEVKSGYKLLDAIPQYYNLDDIEAVRRPLGMFGKTISLKARLVVQPET